MRTSPVSSTEALLETKRRLARLELDRRGFQWRAPAAVREAAPRQVHLGDLSIRTKDRRLLRLEPNASQQAYLSQILPQWERAPVGLRGLREILLKARQQGFSTLVLALYYLDTISHPHTQTVVIAHDADSTERLFQIVHRFQDTLADAPATKYSSRRELSWPELDSYMYVGTAGSGEYGRGGTINNVHGSEVAFWPAAEEIVAGLLEAVPLDGNVVLESTANGMANWYHDEYQAATRGESVFRPRFFGWNLMPEYRLDPEPAFARTGEERTLADRHGLDDAQLAWRRWKAQSLRDKLPQEYPINAHEAFIASGGRVLSEFIPQLAPVGHLCPDFIPPRHWRHYLVVDPGWRVTGAIWNAIDREGRWWIYADYYESEKRPEEHVKAWHAQWERFGRPDVDVLMDPAGFTKRRTDTGHEHDSWAEECYQACDKLRIQWFLPRKANNHDPQALRVKRYLAADRIRVCEGCKAWRHEQERWTMMPALSGAASQVRRDPDKPIDKFNHLMDPTRYLGNELPEPEAPAPKRDLLEDQSWLPHELRSPPAAPPDALTEYPRWSPDDRELESFY